MVEPQTLSQILPALERDGYTEGFKASSTGMRAYPSDLSVDPEDLRVDKIYRFEGETNLDDEEIIFALSCPKLKLKGTYIIAYGPKMDPIDAAMVQRLQERFKKSAQS